MPVLNLSIILSQFQSHWSLAFGVNPLHKLRTTDNFQPTHYCQCAGSFFFTSEDLGRMFDRFISCLHFFFFCLVEISSCTRIPLFLPGLVHRGSASWDNCGLNSLTSCVWACLLIGSLNMPEHNCIVSPLRLHWIKSACVFRCNLPPALLAEWQGSFYAQLQ